MSSYFFGYYGGREPDSPEEGAEAMARWQSWLAGLGEAVINPGTPLGMSKVVSAGGVSAGGGPNPLKGFTIVKADNMDAALEMAKGCPFLEMGTVEVSEVMEM
jgi:YCII-related domain-containing protein